MFGQVDWMEIAKIGVAALTPIMTAVLSIVVVRMGNKLDVTKQLHQELLRKRLELFDEVAPKLNDIYCFFQAIGHWAELSPGEVIKCKRGIDRAIAVNRYLFHSAFWDAYQRFETAHFELYSSAGQPARLRLDLPYIRERTGAAFKEDWMAYASSKTGDHAQQSADYHTLMRILGDEMKAS